MLRLGNRLFTKNNYINSYFRFMIKPLLKITFKEPTRLKIDNLFCWVNFILVRKTMRTTQFLYFHFGKYKTKTELNFDYVQLSEIKSIEFINPNEL